MVDVDSSNELRKIHEIVVAYRAFNLMKPSITINKKGEILKASLVSKELYGFFERKKASERAKLVSGFLTNGQQERIASLKVFGCDIDYRVLISDQSYTLQFLIEENPMSQGPQDGEKYKLIVEAANEIIYETDAAGDFTYVNPKTLKVTGYERNEIIGKSYLELIHPEYREEAQQFYRKQAGTREKSTYKELPIITKNGEQFWIGLNVQLLENAFQIMGFLGVGRDITESYYNRLALKQSEEKYRGIIQNLQYGLMEVDLNQKIVFANPVMTEITGYTPEELIGKVATEFLVDEEARKIIASQQHKRSKGSASVYEIPLKHKDGSYRWAMISGAPIYNVDGSIRGSIGIHMDITNRKLAEEELKETKAKLSKYKNGLEAINSVTSNLSLSSVSQIDQGLKIATEYLGLDLAIISEINGASYEIKQFYSNTDDTGLNIGDKFKLGDTFCDIVIKKDDILFMKDVSESKYYDHPCHELFGVESYIGIAYRVNGEKRGTINFTSTKARKEEFDTYDLEFVELFSKWMGYTLTLIENQEKLEAEQRALARKNKELERNQKHLSAINGFVTSLLSDDSIQEISWEIAENVIEKFGYEDCVIYLKNDESGKLDQVAAYGAKQSKTRKVLDPISIEIGEGIVGAVAQTGIAEIVNDTSKDGRYIVDDAVRFSEITVPIIADGEVIGVIDSEHRQRNFFNQEHLHTLTTIANLASNRLKNAIAKKKQEKAEKELIESEQKLRKILHNAIDAVITIDREGVITEWNRQAESIFGFTADEALGKTLLETIIPPIHREAHKRGMQHFFKTGEGPVLNQKIEITALRKNGEEFPVAMAIIPVENKGYFTFTAFLSDITIQKQVQEEMQKALEKERELNELKSRFVSMTSHEFRTPLTTIKQNADLISFQLEGQHPDDFPRYKKFLDRIDGDLNRVTSLMNDILMLGKIEAGRINMKKSSTDLVQFVERLVNKHSEADSKGRKIKMEVVGVPREVSIDSSLMEHVFSNLLSNALKYSPNSEAPEVQVAFNELKSVRVSIKDYGIGIPQKDLKGLFGSFYRATNVKNIQGTGLGLSIVKEFTELHGGTITVDSEENKGSEFTVELPLS